MGMELMSKQGLTKAIKNIELRIEEKRSEELLKNKTNKSKNLKLTFLKVENGTWNDNVNLCWALKIEMNQHGSLRLSHHHSH